MWQGLRIIRSFGNKSSAEVSADPLLADKLNSFYGRFECNGDSTTLPISASESSRQSSKDHVITMSGDEVRRELKRVNVRSRTWWDYWPCSVVLRWSARWFTSIFNESLATSVVPTSFIKKNLSSSLCLKTINPLVWMNIVQLPKHQ